MRGEVTPEDEARMLRADAWFRGDIPMEGIQARLTGEDIPYRQDSMIAAFGDDACFVQKYTPEPPPEDAVLQLRQVYGHIRKLRVPAERLEYQRNLWRDNFAVAGMMPSKGALMRLAAGTADVVDLPLGLLIFGRHADGRLLVLLQTHVLAPLDLVLSNLKERTRLFS